MSLERTERLLARARGNTNGHNSLKSCSVLLLPASSAHVTTFWLEVTQPSGHQTVSGNGPEDDYWLVLMLRRALLLYFATGQIKKADPMIGTKWSRVRHPTEVTSVKPLLYAASQELNSTSDCWVQNCCCSVSSCVVAAVAWSWNEPQTWNVT